MILKLCRRNLPIKVTLNKIKCKEFIYSFIILNINYQIFSMTNINRTTQKRICWYLFFFYFYNFLFNLFFRRFLLFNIYLFLWTNKRVFFINFNILWKLIYFCLLRVISIKNNFFLLLWLSHFLSDILIRIIELNFTRNMLFYFDRFIEYMWENLFEKTTNFFFFH